MHEAKSNALRYPTVMTSPFFPSSGYHVGDACKSESGEMELGERAPDVHHAKMHYRFEPQPHEFVEGFL